jgi:formate dehydrogenase alpha subunit
MKIPSVCIYCGTGCKIYLKVRGEQVVETLPHEKGPGEGRLCIKGWSAHEFIHHPDRLKFPMINTGEGFEKTSWEQALNTVAEKLMKVKEEYGPDSIAFLSSAKATNEENYLLQKFARAVIGTNNVDHCARLCHASTVTGLVSSFGSGAMTNSQEDVEKSDVIFIIGSNTSEQHPLIARRIIKAVKKGSKLIIADPRRIDLVEYASIYMSHEPGSDVALLNGMMNVIIKEELYDEEFIKKRTEGFEEIKKIVENFPPEKVEETTGVKADSIYEAARLYGKAEKASLFFSMGITQHTTGVDNVVSTANLALLTGNVGKEGAGVNPLRGQNNVQGACDMGALPNYLPGYGSVTDISTRDRFSGKWNSILPTKTGLTLVEMMNSCGDKIKAMYIMGENPLISDPNVNHVKKQLEKLDFLVVAELFMSETAEIADVVLPAASYAEKDGTFTATDRRVQRIKKAIEPLGESMPDWRIISRLSEKMGHKFDYSSPQEIMNEIASTTPLYGGITHSRLEDYDLRWPCLDSDHPGTRILHQERFSRGLGKFHPTKYKPPAEITDKEYPFILTTGRILFHWHTGTMTRRSKTLTDQINEAIAEMNISDANELGIENGDLIKVTSRRGEITLKANTSNNIKQGVIFIPFHYAEAPANKLTNNAIDPLAKIPELKVCAVKIEKISLP